MFLINSVSSNKDSGYLNGKLENLVQCLQELEGQIKMLQVELEKLELRYKQLEDKSKRLEDKSSHKIQFRSVKE